MFAWYTIAAYVAAIFTFIGVWTFAILLSGFSGVIFGWIVAAIVALIVGLLWPVVALLAAGFLLVLVIASYGSMAKS
jgi:hypothetical protein